MRYKQDKKSYPSVCPSIETGKEGGRKGDTNAKIKHQVIDRETQ
jgi:hypothetical protein